MKFKLINENTRGLDTKPSQRVLSEATLTSIENIIRTAIAGHAGVVSLTMDNDKKWYILETSLGNKYCIPVIESSRQSSTDYKKLRYSGNGVIRNGEIFSPSGAHVGRAYYGVPTNHTHVDYDDVQLYQYGKHPAANGAGISLTAFVNQADLHQI